MERDESSTEAVNDSFRIIVDLNNLAWTLRARADHEGPPVAALISAVAMVRQVGAAASWWIAGFGDANLPHVVRDPSALPELAAALDSYQLASPGCRADELIIAAAEEHDALILSNDRFREYKKRGGWARRNLWRVTVPVLATADGVDLQPLYCVTHRVNTLKNPRLGQANGRKTE